MPVSGWGRLFTVLLAPRGGHVELTPDTLRVTVGVMGSARVPVAGIARISRMDWRPVWGLGVRIGRGLVAYVLRSGPSVLIELEEPISVRAPLPWRTQKVVVRVDDVDGLMAALAAARSEARTG